MSIDPNDEAQVEAVAKAEYLSWAPFTDAPPWDLIASEFRVSARAMLIALRDHLAEQPRVIELPAEDRTRKYLGSTMWRPKEPGAWINDQGGVNNWTGMLDLDGPLTDAGPA